jgi:Family of unknown function (DUF5761)
MATKYLPTPLDSAFFSDFNREQLHQAIIQRIKASTGYVIDRQSDADLQSLMKKVFVNMRGDPYTNVKGQLDAMNRAIVTEACQTIESGVLQQLVYLRDISANPVPELRPTSTSTYGNKLPQNFKFGF